MSDFKLQSLEFSPPKPYALGKNRIIGLGKIGEDVPSLYWRWSRKTHAQHVRTPTRNALPVEELTSPSNR